MGLSKIYHGRSVVSMTQAGFNNMVEAVDTVREPGQELEGRAPLSRAYGQAIRVYNGSTVNLRPGEVCGIEDGFRRRQSGDQATVGAVYGPDAVFDISSLVMDGTNITDASVHKFAVTSQIINKGETGWAYTSGIAAAKVRFRGDDDVTFIDRADVDATLAHEAGLVALAEGAAAILTIDNVDSDGAAPPDAPHYRWCLVQLGPGQDLEYLGRTESGGDSGDSIVVRLFTNDSTPEFIPGDGGLINAELLWMTQSTDTITASTDVLVKYFHKSRTWHIVGAACPTE
ncbi:MAG: hypothetical protein GY753_02120 [Gammaproteobacteria bacterium]|nr:hypothetical protein [Gammaproteobacteria bacterium]